MEELISRDIVRFCAIECKLQMSGELSVHWMVDAWIYAQHVADPFLTGKTVVLPTLDDVVNVGRLIEPNVNVGPGFRRVDVRVGQDVKLPWQQVPTAMVNLMENLDSFTPNEFFKEYEDIHPWRDGNGRSGVLLFNWLNGTLDAPEWAENFWNDPRRTVGYGA